MTTTVQALESRKRRDLCRGHTCNHRGSSIPEINQEALKEMKFILMRNKEK